MALTSPNGYGDLSVFFGDLHNHCDLSYGRGSLADALTNARLQLDFASVTVHAVWPDLPEDDPELDYLVEYHRVGFARAMQNWPGYLAEMEAQNQPGRFITFPSFEWHSRAYGDYCVYYNPGPEQAPNLPILNAADLPDLRRAVKEVGVPAFVIPHHIGYRRGYRGINWAAFDGELSPVAEIFSFHGQSESSEGPYPYLHSMGPRHEESTAQYGWSQGHLFGLVGSTDHHNAFPGGYGYGRLGVWAESLSREAIWQAIAQRRTYALTGDRIELAFGVNGRRMGDIGPASRERAIDVHVQGGDAIDYVEVLHNNQILHRESCFPAPVTQGRFKLHVEVGWGERSQEIDWDVALSVSGGRLCGVEPRFRGYGPTDAPEAGPFAYTDWQQPQPNRVAFQTRTRKNPSLHTAATEGICLEIEGDGNTQIQATINGTVHTLCLGDLFTGSRTFYLGGFVSPAVCFHRAVPESAYTCRFTFPHEHLSAQRDWYHVRVRQRNDQWAWSSPVWVESGR